ncbi:MAG: DUF5658 family protein [Fimbriimonadales bacterium]|nr:DUF5658 family protein [Fimbriimonadales bacterium]
MFHRPLPFPAVALLVVAMTDLLLTVVLLGHGFDEGNPLFRELLNRGPAWFIGGKAALVAGPILLLEALRPRAPKRVAQAYWLCLLLYVGLLGLHLASMLGFRLGALR